MKNVIILFLVGLMLSSCGITKKNITSISKDLSIDIIKNRGTLKSGRWIELMIVFTNNSNEDITILRPSMKYGHQIDFFESIVKDCSEEMDIEVTEDIPEITRGERELITIKSKSKRSLMVNGRLYHIICNGTSVSVQINYNSNKISKEMINKLSDVQKKIFKKITKINVQSKPTTIELE